MRRLALLLAAALALGAATPALAQSRGHHGGGDRGAPHMSAPRMGGRPVGGARAPWTGPPGRMDGAPGRGPFAPPARVYGGPAPGGPWEQPRPMGGWNGYPGYAGPPGYPAPASRARAWRRGGYLPPSYPGDVVQDFGRYRLRRPPSGYNWVREGNEFLLVSSGSGLIFDVVPAY